MSNRNRYDPPNMPGLNHPTGIDFNHAEWETPTDLAHAKKLLGTLRGYKTRKKFDEFMFPSKKIAEILNKANAIWSQMLRDAINNLTTYGMFRARHFLLSHSRTSPDYQDKIYTNCASFTISRTLHQSKHLFWIKEIALTTWIECFLPRFDKRIFTKEEQECLKANIIYY